MVNNTDVEQARLEAQLALVKQIKEATETEWPAAVVEHYAAAYRLLEGGPQPTRIDVKAGA